MTKLFFFSLSTENKAENFIQIVSKEGKNLNEMLNRFAVKESRKFYYRYNVICFYLGRAMWQCAYE